MLKIKTQNLKFPKNESYYLVEDLSKYEIKFNWINIINFESFYNHFCHDCILKIGIIEPNFRQFNCSHPNPLFHSNEDLYYEWYFSWLFN